MRSTVYSPVGRIATMVVAGLVSLSPGPILRAQQQAARPVSEVTIDELSMRKNAVKQITPLYPPSAVQSKQTGVVVVDIHVDPDGRVDRAAVLQAPNSEIGNAALDAAKQWQFAPVRVGRDSKGPMVGVSTKLTFYFSMPSGSAPLVSGPKQSSDGPRGVLEQVDTDSVDAWLRDSKATFLDSRPRAQFKRSNDPRSRNIPGDELVARIAEVSSNAVLLDCRQIEPQLCSFYSQILIDGGVKKVGRLSGGRD